jgi:MFS family permease
MSEVIAETKKPTILSRSSAMSFLVTIAIVALFSDMVYEGARSLNGQFLSFLGASATAVGLVAGAGELLGYALRFVSGYVSDRTHRYWTITLVGYGINLLAPPLLALAGRWEWAIALIFAERVGKAIRIPARDAMLSHAASQLGAGKTFGLHETLDQIGAFFGPILISAVLFLRRNTPEGLETYHAGYTALFIPALLALAVLVLARLRFPNPSELESKSPRLATTGFNSAYWWHLFAAALVAAGFADFPLLAFHFERTAVLPIEWIPATYALAMAVDAAAALALGQLFDKRGITVTLVVFGGIAFVAPLAFLGNATLALLGMVLWGIGMGAQETILKAAIARLVPRDKRSTGYGLFHTAFGIFWFAGSALMGFLYDRSIIWLVVFSVAIQLAAAPFFFMAARRSADAGAEA